MRSTASVLERGSVSDLAESFEAICAELQVPGAGSFEAVVDIVDVLYTRGFEPLSEGCGSIFRVDSDAVFPSGAAAEYAVELGPGLARELEGLDEDGVG